jgi:hypothetical protein
MATSMDRGYGAPFVKAVTSLGTIQALITDFSYKFSEIADDLCQIRIESDDHLLPDQPIFQEGVEYNVIWGYIGDTVYQKRLVVLRNIKVAYTEEGISMDLLLTDKAALIKTNSSKRVYNNKTVFEIAKDVGKRAGIAVDYLWDYKANAGLLAAPTALSSPLPDPDQNGPPTSYEPINYFNPERIVDLPSPVAERAPNKDIRKYLAMATANRSDYETIKDAADNDPSGPYEVVGRDATLTIKKPNFKQKPLRTYKWKGEDGHLLQFTPESKEYYVGPSHLGVSTTSVDPKTKTFEQTTTTEGNNGLETKLDYSIGTPNYDNEHDAASDGKANNASQPQSKPVPVNNNSGGLTFTSAQGSPKTLQEIYQGDKSYNPNKVLNFTQPKKSQFANKVFSYTKYNSNSDDFVNSAGFNVTAVSTTATEIRVPNIPMFQSAVNSPTIEDDHKKASGKAATIQSKKSAEKNPATAKVVGNVILESGKLITIDHVAIKFSGNYYINEATHRLNPESGYFVDMSFVRGATGKLPFLGVNTVPASSKYKELGNELSINATKGDEKEEPPKVEIKTTSANKPPPVKI